MAQYYGVLDYRGLSPSLVATLVVVLPAESRIMRKYSRIKLTLEQSFMAIMIDCLQIIIWQRSKNGKKGREKPKSLYLELTEDKKKDELEAFDEPDDYLKWRKNKGM